MHDRPPTPKCFQMPREILITPIKNSMQKPYWHLRIDGVVHICRTKAVVELMIQDRIKLASISDEQMYHALWARCAGALLSPWDYEHKDDVFVCRSDRHEWHAADEVYMLRWLAEKKINSKAA